MFINILVRIKPQMFLLLVDDSNKHNKAIDLDKNVAATITHNEYKDVLVNNKCLKHSMNRIQSKNHKTEYYDLDLQ